MPSSDTDVDRDAMKADPADVKRRRRVVVWFAGVNWDDIQGTDRSLVLAMARPVLWVDRGISPLHGGAWTPFGRPAIDVVQDRPYLWRLTPAVPPFGSRSGLRRLSALMIRWQTQRALRTLRAKPAAVVLTHLSELLRGWPDGTVRVLYGTDDYVAGARLMGLSSRWLEGLEAQCLEDADVVLAVSDDLASKWHEQGRNVNVLPNGCKPLPESAGARSDDEAIVSPGAGDGDGRPVVGLIGQLSSRINMTLLEALADGGLRMVLVGPVDPQWEPERFAALQARPTVQWTGRVPAEALPDLLASMDVGITPYADSAFNRASFPLKTLEYLAAGLPAVVTDIPASQWLRNDLVEALGADAAAHHLAVATDPDQFVSSVRRLGLQRNAILRKERRQYAETHSWAARARQLDAVLGPVQ